MGRILITGMSGTGKSSVVEELAQRGFRAIDTDTDEWCEWVTDGTGQADWVWREDRMAELLAGGGPLFVCGCKSNQGQFYDRFDHIVLLSAPEDVILQRVTTRTTNPYGQTPEQRGEILGYLRDVEPLLRRGADAEFDTSRMSVRELADALVRLNAG